MTTIPTTPRARIDAAGMPAELQARLGAPIVGQVIRFGAIGVVSTLAYVALYAILREWLPATASNAIALVVTAVGNTAANRRFTFAVRGAERMLRDQLAGLAAFGIALAMTTVAVEALRAAVPEAPRALEIVVLGAANAVATVTRFVVLRRAIGDRGARPCEGPPQRRTLDRERPGSDPAAAALTSRRDGISG